MSSRHCKTTFDHFSLLLRYQVTSLVRISLPNLLDRKTLGGGTRLHYNRSNLGFEREQGRGVNARCDVIPHVSSPPHLSGTFSNLNPGGLHIFNREGAGSECPRGPQGEAGGKQKCFPPNCPLKETSGNTLFKLQQSLPTATTGQASSKYLSKSFSHKFSFVLQLNSYFNLI